MQSHCGFVETLILLPIYRCFGKTSFNQIITSLGFHRPKNYSFEWIKTTSVCNTNKGVIFKYILKKHIESLVKKVHISQSLSVTKTLIASFALNQMFQNLFKMKQFKIAAYRKILTYLKLQLTEKFSTQNQPKNSIGSQNIAKCQLISFLTIFVK